MSWVTEKHRGLVMASSRIICAALAASFAMGAQAQSLEPGTTAPASVVQQLKGVQSVNIGMASVRPVSPGGGSSGLQASANRATASVPTGNETTTVVRSTDNLVGVSSNDLVVMYGDTGAVTQAVAGKGVTAKAFPAMGMVVVHVSSFDEIGPLQSALSAKFPTAKFDLPVKYFETEPN
jgi:hypothetical protein